MRRFGFNLSATFVVTTLLFLTGCGGGSQSYTLLSTGQSFTQSTSSFNNQLDILWVVDNSGSMAPLQTNMTNNFQSFISNFQTKGYNFRMAVTSTDAYKANTNFVGYRSAYNSLSLYQDGACCGSPSGVFVIIPTTPNLNPTFTTNATTGINGSGDERAFSSMMTALKNPNNPAFLRPSSFFAVIILSDEDDFSNYSRAENSWGNNNAQDHCYYDTTMDTNSTTPYSGANHVSACKQISPATPPDSINSYVSALDTLTGTTGAARRYNVSAITVLDNNCQQIHQQDSASNVTIIGQRYVQLSQATNGVQGSLCDASYANSLNAIQSQIATLSTQFFLNRTPDPTTITVTVNGVGVPNNTTNGWAYNSAANSIEFFGSAIPPQNASINVEFEPTTIIGGS